MRDLINSPKKYTEGVMLTLLTCPLPPSIVLKDIDMLDRYGREIGWQDPRGELEIRIITGRAYTELKLPLSAGFAFDRAARAALELGYGLVAEECAQKAIDIYTQQERRRDLIYARGRLGKSERLARANGPVNPVPHNWFKKNER